MILSVSVILVTFMVTKSRTFFPFARMDIDREKATTLAFGGLELARSQLSVKATPLSPEAEKKNAQQKSEESATDRDAKALLQEILPSKNQWQTFELKKERDGIDAKLQIAIMSEEGKIDINKIYDFKTQKFIGENQPKGDYKKLMKDIFERIEKISGTKDLFQGFEKFLKERQYRVNDVTQLVSIKEFEPFKNRLFYQPAAVDTEKKEAPTLYLTDIFTTWSSSAQLQPWLFSQSIITLLGLTSTTSGEKESKERMSGNLKNFKSHVSWQTDWKTSMVPLYSKELSALPKDFESLLNPTFQANMMSVLVAATVGKITQKLYAIIERSEPAADTPIESTIKKIYWL